MNKKKDESHIFRVHCPSCHSLLWIDPVTSDVIKSEKEKKKKGSLDELLLKEKKRKDDFERKFESTAELEKERWRQAQKNFKKALNKYNKNE